MSEKWCIIKSCPNSFYHATKPLDTVKIFSFPALERRKNTWIEILNVDRELLTEVKGVGVCQRHFKLEHIFKSEYKVWLYKDACPLYFLDDQTQSTSEKLNKMDLAKMANILHQESSTPFGGEFLRYLEKNTYSITGRQYKTFPGSVLHPADPPSFLIEEIDELEELVNPSAILSTSPVTDLNKEDDNAWMSTLSSSSTDFNLDLFNEVDSKEIEQYKSHFPNLEKIADSKLHCTTCNYHIGTAPFNEAIIEMHPILRVTQCKKCFTFYNSGEFECGEDGSELYCRWCGQGGEVFCCSNCPYVFCRRCVSQNMSLNMVAEIQNNENWNCFSCAPQCMIPLRANHWALVNFIEKQKRQIINQSSDEKEIKELMNNDISSCCTINKNRFSLKRKLENTAIITLAPVKKQAIDPKSSPTVLNASLKRKASKKKTSSGEDDSEVVQYTHDILSLVNKDKQSSSSALNKHVPLAIDNIPALNPVYHTINGFRIDLNTAALQNIIRLPDGRLIQVKKLPPNPTQANPTTPERSPPKISRPPLLIPNRPQLFKRTYPSRYAPMSRPQSKLQHRQPIQSKQRFIGNLNQRRLINGPIIHQLNIAPQEMNSSHSPSSEFRKEPIKNPPVEDARTQFEELIDNSMEVCQHIINKINTLIKSSSYKTIKSPLDLKDLTIHLSYLLTYAIGRFKILQEKCMKDLKNLRFDNTMDFASDDDDIEIVEPKTTTINLDSDEEYDRLAAAINNTEYINHTEEVVSISNRPKKAAIAEQNVYKPNKVIVDVLNLLDEPIYVTEDGKLGEKNANNKENIIKAVEITGNEDKFEILGQTIFNEKDVKTEVILPEDCFEKISTIYMTVENTIPEVRKEISNETNLEKLAHILDEAMPKTTEVHISDAIPEINANIDDEIRSNFNELAESIAKVTKETTSKKLTGKKCGRDI